MRMRRISCGLRPSLRGLERAKRSVRRSELILMMNQSIPIMLVVPFCWICYNCTLCPSIATLPTIHLLSKQQKRSCGFVCCLRAKIPQNILDFQPSHSARAIPRARRPPLKSFLLSSKIRLREDVHWSGIASQQAFERCSSGTSS